MAPSSDITPTDDSEATSVSHARAFIADAARGRTFDALPLSLCANERATRRGTFACELDVTEALTNRFGTLHGGAIATLVDVLTTAALLTMTTRGGVSTDLNVSYVAPARVGTRVFITCEVLKVGKTLAWMSCEMRNEDGIVAVGRHTKFLPVSLVMSKL